MLRDWSHGALLYVVVVLLTLTVLGNAHKVVYLYVCDYVFTCISIVLSVLCIFYVCDYVFTSISILLSVLCSLLQFWKVSSMEHLLARLERDSPSVSKRIVNLLFSSFFPVNQSELVWCERCVTLIQMSPKAARKFYQYAHLYTAPNNLGETIHFCTCSGVALYTMIDQKDFAYFQITLRNANEILCLYIVLPVSS